MLKQVNFKYNLFYSIKILTLKEKLISIFLIYRHAFKNKIKEFKIFKIEIQTKYFFIFLINKLIVVKNTQ